MPQFYNPYSYQANNIFNMGIPDWKKRRWMDTPITAAEAESMSNPFMQVNRVQPNTDYTAGGTQGNPAARIGDIGYIPPGPASQGYSGPVSQTGRPSVGMGKDFTGYTKSLDKSFLMAALQSAIPEDQPAPKGVWGGGAHGGGNNLADIQPFLTGERRKNRNPALWRYS